MIRSKIAMGFLWAFLALALHVLPGVVAPAHAQGSRKDDIVFNSRGIPLAGATVRVCAMPASGQPCTPLALIYSDAALTQALANPTTTDGLGNYSFYAAPGKYEIEISGPGITTKQIPNVFLPNDPSSPNFSAVSAFSLNLGGNLTVNGNSTVIGNLASGTLNLSNQSTPPGAAGSGTVNLYTKTGDKLLYYKDETGTETGPLGPGAQTNVANNWTAPQNFNANQRFKGPNPYVDITAFGARAVNPNAAPAAPGITANCTNGSASVTISSASTFVNGDGAVLYGCGAPHSMTTPSAPAVVPALALNGTGTGIVTTTTPTGATTYNYQIIARDQNGGLTAPSTVGSTTTGAASLGAQTVNITSMSRSGTTVTVTTAATHGFNVGCGAGNCGEVYISGGNGLTNSSFQGWYLVTSAANGTTFTFAGPLDASKGAATSATGGTATYFSANHLTWSAVTGAWQYYIYSDRANPGTFVLVGVSRPQGTNTDLTWDDFGSPMMDNFAFPPYVPNTPPGAATSDHLSTTITGGAGTTTLTLANAAGTTVSGATIRLDAGPGIKAAATAANGVSSGTVLIPADSSGNSFVVNSFTDLHGMTFTLSQSGSLYLNETLELGDTNIGFRWYGDINSSYGQTGAAVGPAPYPQVKVDRANPGVYFPGTFGVKVKGLTFTIAGTGSNGSLQVLAEGGFRSQWEDLSFSTGTSSNDLMGVGLYMRGSSGQTPTDAVMDKVGFSSGNTTSGTSHNGGWFCIQCGIWQVRDLYQVHRGNIFQGDSLTINQAHINGGGTPLVSASVRPNAANTSVVLGTGTITMDTIAHPCVAMLTNSQSFVSGTCSPSSGTPPVTGSSNIAISNTGSQFSPGFTGPVQPNSNSYSFASGLDTNNLFTSLFGVSGSIAADSVNAIFINGPVMAQPTCSVSAGGSIALATYTFKVVALWQNNKEGVPSVSSTSCTTTSGQQTITINWSTVTGNPKGYNVYWSNGGGYGSSNSFANPQSPTTTSLVWSSPGSTLTVLGDGRPSGGPTMLMSGTQGIAAPALTFAGSSISPPASGFTANRNISFPDNSGIIPVSSYQNSAYDNATRATGAIGSNWTVTNNGINISSNNFIGTVSNANDVAYWAANAFGPPQFSQVTLTALNGTTDFPGTAVLLSGSGGATHGYSCVEDTTNIFIQKITGTANTTLTSAATTGAAGDILRLEADSAGNLTCYKNGVSTLTLNDTTYTSGSPGLFLFGTVATSKNWSGGNLHPLSHLDSEQDWTKPQHFTQGIALGGAASESFNNNPRAEQNVFLPGALTSTWTGSTWTTDKPVTITRVQVQAKTAPSGCTTNAVVRLTDGTTPVNLTISAAANDSGAIAQNYAAGVSLTVAVQTAAAGCTTSPADANVTVQYRMQ